MVLKLMETTLANTLAIVYPVFDVGGIQQNCYKLIQYALSAGCRVVWFYMEPKTIASPYSNLFEKIESYPFTYNYTGNGFITNASFKKDEKVNILTFTPSDMHCALLFAKSNKCQYISPLYVVSNTKGRYNYIERYYWGVLKKIVYHRFKKIIAEWSELNLIRFFDINQFFSYQQEYSIDCKNPNDLIWKPIFSTPPLDYQILNHRINRNIFNIISITRFDFPHKQYLLGLIRDFSILCHRYSNIRLHIVGYGHDEKIVKTLILSLPQHIQRNIFLYGQKKESDILLMMNDMHLNISVAACVGLGAKVGVLSIPARNFCSGECEVYGYLPGSKKMSTATTPGERAIDYIEDVINMSDEEYKQKCIDSYDAYSIKDVDPDYMLRRKDIYIDYSFEANNSKFFYMFCKTRDYFWKIGDIISNLICKY